MIEIERTENTKIYEQVQEIQREYSIEGMVLKAGSRDITDQQGQYSLEAATGPIHYKENYLDIDNWIEIDESYYTDEGEYYLYSKMPNFVKVFKNKCGYEIQNRQNRDHIVTVELISVNGNDITTQINDNEFYFYPRIHPTRVGIWKELKQARSGNTIFKQKITEIGSGGLYSMSHIEDIEAYDSADTSIFEQQKTRISIEGIKTQIDSNSYYFEEVVPKEAYLVDTDQYVSASANDGDSNGSSWYTAGNNVCLGWQTFMTFFSYLNITIPVGSTINSCNITFISAETLSTSLTMNLGFERNGNPTVPSYASDLQSRTQVNNKITAQNPGNQTVGNSYSTPSMITGMQEVIGLSGWSSGNTVNFFVYNPYGDSPYRRTYTYDLAPSYSPKLSITQSTAGWGHKIIGISAGKVIGISKSSIKRIINVN